MKKLKLVLIGIILSISTFAQNNESLFFTGTINADPDFIDIIIEVRTESAQTNAYLYIPNQFVYAMKAADVFYNGDSLRVSFKKMSAVYTGVRGNDTSEFTGVWKQGTPEFETNLKLVDNSEVEFLQRPQTPELPVPYIEKEICVENVKGKSTLCGTLTIPDTVGTYPLVIMVTGSGAQDRNEEIAGHKPFLIIADYLTRSGIAVFRYDDRGVAKSKGDVVNSTTYDFMTDAAAVILHFENYPNIDNNMIGVAGHSEGGIIAMMLAAKYSKNVDFIISLAGPGIPMRELLLKQMDDISRAEDIPEEHLKILFNMQSELLDLATKKMELPELRKEIKAVYDKYGANFTEELRNEYRMNESGLNMAVLQFSQPWIRYFLTIDPSVYLKKIKCPVLALNGTKDIQVSSKENLAAIEKYLSEGKCKNIKIVELEGLNHIFQKSETGQVQDYYKIQHTISPEVLPLLVEFINSLRK
jgi:uncharacterized protein